ncbi:MAG: hypothetical protein PHW62_04720 [Candidatus Ratteibacteria bacterium]|nr:hypothetical protein [Candidatus Ratteibacteria bacterium]
MVNNILLWCKENCEKLIFGVLAILLVITIVGLLLGKDVKKELENFTQEMQPPKKPVVQPIDSIYTINLDPYLKEKPIEYYQPIADRNVFFPYEKKTITVIPDMNLECTGVISNPDGTFSAVLRNTMTNITYNVMEGQQIEKFLVVSISRDVVVLSGEGRTYRLNPPPVMMPFKLTGIMPTDTGLEAMLYNETAKKTYFLKVGDKVEDWDVLNISENAVIISKSGFGKYELKSGGESNRIQ